ncbi:MAG: tRNA (adenosine(37)-N6)-threonylcarbamoyltransferase complex transferase subunit TsaD [Alphaproteobacteria bacterium]
MLVLGIESSCDETAVAVVNDQRLILGHQIYSQIAAHQPFGGVVPEIAARQHGEYLPKLITQTLNDAGVSLSDIDGFCATAGPGLIGGLIVGSTMARCFASFYQKPYIPINHLEGHALSVRLSHDIQFPYLLLLVSGGHTMIVLAHQLGNYSILGSSIDDAAGETFDKIAKWLGLGWPGGPTIEKLARLGNPHRFKLPMPLMHSPQPDFSFSGLKTAARQLAESLRKTDGSIADEDIHDLCASLQDVVAKILATKFGQALAIYKNQYPHGAHGALVGGVAANQHIRNMLQQKAESHNVALMAPPLSLCTDNAAMIAWVGMERLQKGLITKADNTPRPRWPLQEMGT